MAEASDSFEMVGEVPPEYIYPALRPEGNLFGAKLGQDLESFGLPGVKPGEFFEDNAGNVYDWLTDQWIMVGEPSTLQPDLSQPLKPTRQPAMAAPPGVRINPTFAPVQDLLPPVPLQIPDLSSPGTIRSSQPPMAAPTAVRRIDLPKSNPPTTTEAPTESVLPDEVKNQYIKEGTMPIVTKPEVPSVDMTQFQPGTAPVPPEPRTPIVLPETSVTTVATTPKVEDLGQVTLSRPTFTNQFQFAEPPPSRTPIALPSESVINRPVGTTTSTEFTTIPTDTRRAPEALLRSFRDINYDPEEILAAAMRSMGGRMARRSILNELS